MHGFFARLMWLFTGKGGPVTGNAPCEDEFVAILGTAAADLKNRPLTVLAWKDEDDAWHSWTHHRAGATMHEAGVGLVHVAASILRDNP